MELVSLFLFFVYLFACLLYKETIYEYIHVLSDGVYVMSLSRHSTFHVLTQVAGLWSKLFDMKDKYLT
jgi:hypothetical protein